MLDAFKQNWRHYLAEATGLAFFMMLASLCATAMRSPLLPFLGVIKEPFWQRVVVGLVLGSGVVAVSYSPWGRKSGSNINPAVTLAFWRMGKIKTPDALFYVLFQFLGGALAVQMMGLILGAAYRDPAINYATTMPGPGGPLQAFVAEFAISFVLMLTILLALNSDKIKHFTGAIAGVLVALFLIFEQPYSGMSLSPARSFASASAARDFANLWIYFVAPPLAMLGACEAFLRLTKSHNNLPDRAGFPRSGAIPIQKPTAHPTTP